VALEYKDRVSDTSTTTGTGTLTLAGSPPAGYRAFTAFTTGDTVRYSITSGDNSEWEVGQGVWTSSGATLTRVTVFASSNAGALVDFAAGTKNVAAVLTAADIIPLNQEVWVQGGNGYGSTNNKIRRFSNTLVNVGSDITYADSAANGGSFTINTTGVYAISYSDLFNAASNMGLSLNSAELTTSILTITAASRIAIGTSAGVNFAYAMGATLRITAGGVIRAHTEGTAESSSPARASIRVTRIA
jgi:hypothetical protein